jgi:hypothetical protein
MLADKPGRAIDAVRRGIPYRSPEIDYGRFTINKHFGEAVSAAELRLQLGFSYPAQ